VAVLVAGDDQRRIRPPMFPSSFLPTPFTSPDAAITSPPVAWGPTSLMARHQRRPVIAPVSAPSEYERNSVAAFSLKTGAQLVHSRDG
jgi:hypothetical protein